MPGLYAAVLKLVRGAADAESEALNLPTQKQDNS